MNAQTKRDGSLTEAVAATVKDLKSRKLYRLPRYTLSPYTSRDIRNGPCALAKFLCRKIKKLMNILSSIEGKTQQDTPQQQQQQQAEEKKKEERKEERFDVCLMNSGCIQMQYDYSNQR